MVGYVKLDTHEVLKKQNQDLAWLVRTSFESAWREAGGDPSKWLAAWKNSKPRAAILAMGYINEEDEYR